MTVTNSNFLSIKGVEVDKVLKVAKAQYRSLKDSEKPSELLTEFRKETLRMAQEVYGTPEPEEYRRTLIANRSTPMGGCQWSSEALRTGYRGCFAEGPLQAQLNTSESLSDLHNPDADQTRPGPKYITITPQRTRNTIERTLSGLYASDAILTCCGRRFITTTKGRVGLAPADCKEGDVIFVFLGSGMPYVLRPNIAGVGETLTFTFVGECYLHGIMNSEVLDMLEREDTDLELRGVIIT